MAGKPTATRHSRRHAGRGARARGDDRGVPPASADQGGPSWRRTAAARLLPLLAPLAALIAYNDSFTAPFVFDDRSIVESRALHDVWSLRLVTGTTRPLVQLSLALNHALGGVNVVGYHVVNFAVHALASITLFGIVARTLRLPRFGPRSNAAAPGVA